MQRDKYNGSPLHCNCEESIQDVLPVRWSLIMTMEASHGSEQENDPNQRPTPNDINDRAPPEVRTIKLEETAKGLTISETTSMPADLPECTHDKQQYTFAARPLQKDVDGVNWHSKSPACYGLAAKSTIELSISVRLPVCLYLSLSHRSIPRCVGNI